MYKKSCAIKMQMALHLLTLINPEERDFWDVECAKKFAASVLVKDSEIFVPFVESGECVSCLKLLLLQ